MNIGIKFNRKLKISYLITLISIGLILAIFSYHNYMYNYILDVQSETSEQISSFVESAFQTKIEEAYNSLEAFSKFINLNSIDTIKYDISNFQIDDRFNVVGYANTNGQSINSLGTQKDASQDEFFVTAMSGQRYLSNVINAQDGNEYILIAVPIIRQSTIQGVLYSWCDADLFIKNLCFDQESQYYLQIITASGQYISKSENEHALVKPETQNLFEELTGYTIKSPTTIESIQEAMSSGQSGVFRLDYNNHIRYVAYRPIGINDWYMFSVFTNESVNLILNKLNIYVGLISIAFLGLSHYIYSYFKKTNRLITLKNIAYEKQNKILNIVLENTYTIPFGIDLSKQIITLYYYNTEAKKGNTFSIPLNSKSFIRHGLIDSQQQQELDRFFEDVKSGKTDCEKVLKFKIQDTERWMKIKILENNEIDHVILGVINDFMDEKLMDEKLTHQTMRYTQLKNESMYDELTQVLSRKTITSKIDQFLQKTTTHIHAFCIIDLDNFKQINDQLGHMTGDQLLKDVANHMKNHLRSDDYVGRLGGDEFICFIKDLKDVEDVTHIINGLVERLILTYGNKGHEVHVSGSIGIALAPIHGVKFKDLYHYADLALYETKRKGKNGFTIYNDKQNVE